MPHENHPQHLVLELKEETFNQGCPTKSDRQELGGDVEESEMQGVEP